jgi:tetratricopeptide (TPR) repeat protein
MVVFHSQMIMWLGEAQLLSGAVTEAGELSEQALTSTRERKERGLEAWAVRLAAEVTTHREPLDIEAAARLYRQALAAADALEMRALAARCHLGLGILYRRTGKHGEARSHLATAMSQFMNMGMRLWPAKAEAELERLP